MFKNFISKMLYLLSEKSRFTICRQHINKQYAENNSDHETNGEAWLIQNVLPNCTTVLDVGAHSGDWAKMALSSNPLLSIHCFEPNKKAFSELEGKNFGPNVSCNNFALGAQVTNKPFYIFEGLSEGSSLYVRKGIESIPDHVNKSKQELIKVSTIESYCRKNTIETIDFLKIDVEGHEFEVIKGAKSLFDQQQIKLTLFEYGGTYIDSRTLLLDFFDFFADMPYKLFLLYPKKIQLLERYEQKLENFQYKNFLIASNQFIEKNKFFKKLFFSM